MSTSFNINTQRTDTKPWILNQLLLLIQDLYMDVLLQLSASLLYALNASKYHAPLQCTMRVSIFVFPPSSKTV